MRNLGPAGGDRRRTRIGALILVNLDIQERHGHPILFEQPTPPVDACGPVASSLSRRIGAQAQRHCWPAAVAEPSKGVRVIEPRFYHRQSGG